MVLAGLVLVVVQHVFVDLLPDGLPDGLVVVGAPVHVVDVSQQLAPLVVALL